MNRREFLALSAVATGLPASVESKPLFPIIDTHIHLVDTNRAQGVPWPDKSDQLLYKPALPERYRGIVGPLGIVGAIVVEASPWFEDNQWLIDTAEKDKIIVGVIGNLEPGKPDFGKHLRRFQANPLFRGIRYGNIWGYDIASQVGNPGFISDLKSFARNQLVLDTVSVNLELLATVIKLTDKVPDLKVVIDHLPHMSIPDEATQKAYAASLKEIATRPNVYIKISAVLRRVNGEVSTALDFYRARLDEIYEIFGENRLLYGSDWPNSDQWLPYEAGLNLVSEYFKEKGQAVSEKYFWKNSVAAYSWKKRDKTQPG